MITISAADLQQRAGCANSFSSSLELNVTGLAAIPAGWLKKCVKRSQEYRHHGAFGIKACSELLILLFYLKISSTVQCG